MAFIITASAKRNGTTIDTSNAESLGEWFGHEFTSSADARQECAFLDAEKGELGLGAVTCTVEDIGITETEVASKAADEWWAVMVGDQTPAEFMAISSGDARAEALRYLTDRAVAGEDRYRNEGAKSDLADKLAEVIDALASL